MAVKLDDYGGVKRYTGAKSNFGPKGWLIVLYGFLLFTYSMTLENGLNYFVPALAAQNGWDSTLLLSFSTIGMWFGCVALLVVGFLTRKKGGKFALILGLVVSVVAFILWAFAGSTGVYGLATVIFAMAQVTFCTIGLGSLVANWFPTKKGLVMGWMTMGIVLASILSNVVINPLVANFGTRTTYLIMAAFGAVMTVITLICVKSSPEEAGAYPDNDKSMDMETVRKFNLLGNAYRQTSEWNNYLKCFKSPAVWACGLINGLLLMTVRGIMSQMIPAMITFGYDATFAATLMSSTAIIAFLFSWLGGVVDQKLGTKRAVTVCCFGTAVGCVLFAAFGANYVMMFIALIVFGYSSSAGNNYSISLASEVFGRYDFDVPFSVISVINTLVSSLGFTLISAVAGVASYSVAYVICASICVAAGVIGIVYKGKFEGRERVDESQLDAVIAKLEAESDVPLR